MFCPNCGSAIEEGCAFCSDCGAKAPAFKTSSESDEVPVQLPKEPRKVSNKAEKDAAKAKEPYCHRKIVARICIGIVCMVALVLFATEGAVEYSYGISYSDDWVRQEEHFEFFGDFAVPTNFELDCYDYIIFPVSMSLSAAALLSFIGAALRRPRKNLIFAVLACVAVAFMIYCASILFLLAFKLMAPEPFLLAFLYSLIPAAFAVFSFN